MSEEHYTRRVWRTPKAGNLARLRQEEESLPPLPQGSMRIRVRAVGLNFADIFALAGMYSATPKGSFIPGLEFAGEVTATHSDTSEFAVGDRVMGVCRFGGYCSLLNTTPDRCQLLPKGWSFAEGAAYPVQTLTAWYALRVLGDVQAGQNVLVQSAAGGVGLQAMRLCEKYKATAFGTVGNSEKKTFLEKQGHSRIVVRDAAFPGNLQQLLAGQPVHLVLDAIGGNIQRQCFDLLAPTGRLIVFGAASFAPGKTRPNYFSVLGKYLRRPRYDPLVLINDNKSVMGFNLIWLWNQQPLLASAIDEVTKLQLPPPFVGKEFPFDEAPQAIEHLRSGASVGKVVLIS